MEKLTGATPALGPYSAGVKVGELVFVSGQIPTDAAGNLPEGIEAQAEQSILNVKAVLEAGGSDLQHVVKTTVFLRDMEDFAKVNEVYARYFNGEVQPARSCVQAAKLPKDMPLEIEAIGLVVK
ncbi:MAG: Rid family detoxifying hydrolase [Oscillospiraceae bacterium]|nr:Rid family detoxifying hydrolase [Oscillospiraceae bacterium]